MRLTVTVGLFLLLQTFVETPVLFETSLSRSSPCTVCGKKTTNLQRHMLTHSDVKPFTCNVCKKGYTTRSSLACHYEFKHSGSRKINCMFCSHVFQYRHQLRRHVASKHDSSFKVSCDKCHARFNTAYDLRQHKIICYSFVK